MRCRLQGPSLFLSWFESGLQRVTGAFNWVNGSTGLSKWRKCQMRFPFVNNGLRWSGMQRDEPRWISQRCCSSVFRDLCLRRLFLAPFPPLSRSFWRCSKPRKRQKDTTIATRSGSRRFWDLWEALKRSEMAHFQPLREFAVIGRCSSHAPIDFPLDAPLDVPPD